MAIYINYWAVLVSGVTAIVFGFLWYSPFLFGRIWMKESHRTMEDIKREKNGIGKKYFATFILWLINAYVLAYLIEILNSVTMQQALQLAFWLWLGFCVVATSGALLYEKKSWKLYAIDAIYQLFSLGITATILTLWI